MDPVTFGGRYQAEHFIGVPGRLEAYSGFDTTTLAKVAIITAQATSEAQAGEWTQRAQNAAGFQHADVARLLQRRWAKGTLRLSALPGAAPGTDCYDGLTTS